MLANRFQPVQFVYFLYTYYHRALVFTFIPFQKCCLLIKLLGQKFNYMSIMIIAFAHTYDDIKTLNK